MPESTAREGGSSIVLVVDGLGAGWLGPYGNTWFETPAANRLGAESWLCEQVQIESPTLAGAYASFWRGACPLRGGADEPLPALLSDAGVRLNLLTDEQEVAELPDADHAQRHVWRSPDRDAAAEDCFATGAGQMFAAACELASELDHPFCLWIHLRGLAGLWDAPWEMRGELADEEDPPPPDWVVPPSGPANPDPDTLLGWMQAAAGQVRAIDRCLPALIEIAEQRAVLLTLTSSRGYPLGEHGVAGLDDPPLLSELLHVPLLVRRPDGADASCRDMQIRQGAAVRQCLAHWHGLSERPRGEPIPEPARQLAASAGNDQLAIRTASWFARLRGPELSSIELFVKPDDRGEVNEVANRCRAECEAMLRLAESLRRGETPEVPSLLWQPHR